jgi:hypothetical protein
MNRYPSFGEALGELWRMRSKAFSREFSLQKEGGKIAVLYRSYKVGEVVDGKPVLLESKRFLEQHLNEAMG